jgi:spermidine synthase
MNLWYKHVLLLAVQPFFEALHRAVRVGGIICTQAESLWLHMDVITSLAGMCQQVSVAADAAAAANPTMMSNTKLPFTHQHRWLGMVTTEPFSRILISVNACRYSDKSVAVLADSAGVNGLTASE